MTRQPENLEEATDRVRHYDAVAQELKKSGDYSSLSDDAKRHAVDDAIRKVYGPDADVNAVRAEVASASNDMARVQAADNIRELRSVAGAEKFFQAPQGQGSTPYQRVASDRNALMHPEDYDAPSPEDMDKTLQATRTRAKALLDAGKQTKEVNKLLRGFVDAVDKLNPLSPQDIGPEAFSKGADFNAAVSRDYIHSSVSGEAERVRKRGETAAHDRGGRGAGVLRSLGLVSTAVNALKLTDEILDAHDEISRMADKGLVPEEAVNGYVLAVAVSKVEQKSTMNMSTAIGYGEFEKWAEKYDIDPALRARLDPSGVTAALKESSMASLDADAPHVPAAPSPGAGVTIASAELDTQIRGLARAMAGITVTDRPAPYMDGSGQSTQRIPQSKDVGLA